jgi:hypothetical protein
MGRMLKRSPRSDDVWGRHMDDYSALAYRIAGGVADVRGCLILSRDGLILGSYPDDETAVKPAWVRFASLGDPERSFVEFGDQVWVYVRRPAYGAFAVANAGVRPGLVIDQLEGILTSAEESRNRRDTLRVPEASAGSSAKPPTSSYRVSTNGASTATPPSPHSAESRPWARTAPAAVDGEADYPAVEELATVASAVGQSGDATGADGSGSDPADGADHALNGTFGEGLVAGSDGASSSDEDGAGTTLDGASDTHGTNRKDKPAPMELDADAEVDPVMLAKEFSGLLQVESDEDEVTS